MKKKIISILFALVIMLTLCIIVSADDRIDWSISQDGKTLIVGDKSYSAYEGYFDQTDCFTPEHSYIYGDYSEYYMDQLMRANDSEEVFFVFYAYESSFRSVFVTDKGKSSLDSFLKGNYTSYKISNEYYSKYANTSLDWVNNLDGGSVVKVDVRSLASCNAYYILGYDSTGTMAHRIGAIYDANGTYYFVNYDALPNNYFDAEGEFSYRQGEVNAYKLNTAQSSDMVEFISNMKDFEETYELEKDMFEGIGSGLATVFFIIITAIFGFIIPIAPIIVGLIRIISGKSKNPKRWYLLFVGCALWIILSICILLTLIV